MPDFPAPPSTVLRPTTAPTAPAVDDLLPPETAAQRRLLTKLNRLVYQEWSSSFPSPPARFHRVPRPAPVPLSFVKGSNGAIPVGADPDVVLRERTAIAAADTASRFLSVMLRSDHYIAPTLAPGAWAADRRKDQFVQTIDRTTFLARQLPGLPFVPSSSPDAALLDPLGDRVVQLKTMLLLSEAHQAGRVTIGSWGRLASLPNCLNDPDPVRFLFYLSATIHHAGKPAATHPDWGHCWATLLPDVVLRSTDPGRRYDVSNMHTSWNTTNARFLMDRSIAWDLPRPDPAAMHWTGSSVDLAVLLLSLWVARPMSPIYKSTWGAGLSEPSDQDAEAGSAPADRWAEETALRVKADPWRVLPPAEAPRVLAWVLGLPVDTSPEVLAVHPDTALVLNGLRHRLRAHQRGHAKNRFLLKNRAQLDLFQARLEALPGWTDTPQDADVDRTAIQYRLPNGASMPQARVRVPDDSVPATNARALGLEFAHTDLLVDILKGVAVDWAAHRATAPSGAAFSSPDWNAVQATLSQARLFRSQLIDVPADQRDRFIDAALPLMGPEGPSGLIRLEQGDTAVHQATRGRSGTPPSVSLFQKVLMRARTYGLLSDLANDKGQTPLSFLEGLTSANRSRYDKVLLKEVITAHRKPAAGPKPSAVPRVRRPPRVAFAVGRAEAASEADRLPPGPTRPPRKPKRMM